jgi:hypothetical protein
VLQVSEWRASAVVMCAVCPFGMGVAGQFSASG